MDLICCFFISCLTRQKLYCGERREAVKPRMQNDLWQRITEMRSICVECCAMAFDNSEHQERLVALVSNMSLKYVKTQRFFACEDQQVRLCVPRNINFTRATQNEIIFKALTRSSDVYLRLSSKWTVSILVGTMRFALVGHLVTLKRAAIKGCLAKIYQT